MIPQPARFSPGSPRERCRRLRGKALLAAAAFLGSAGAASAQIGFDDVTQRAGIRYRGQTYGAAWGDVESDGWPDLWVGNHMGSATLYRNDGAGGFVDIARQSGIDGAGVDKHGAAWADFDGDGDQDLVELVGATFTSGRICEGCGSNRLLVNEGGRLREQAGAHGVAGPPGLGRTPLWLDYDSDGRLDLLAVHRRKQDSIGAVLYRQTDAGGFVARGDTGFHDSPLSLYERLLGRAFAFLNGEGWGRPDRFQGRGFAQLVDLDGDAALELLLYASPVRAFSLVDGHLEELTLRFPNIGAASDAASADFDGDGRSDLYVTRGPHIVSDVAEVSTRRWKVLLERASARPEGKAETHGISFWARGDVTIEVQYPDWWTAERIRLGSGGAQPQGVAFRLSPADPVVRGTPDSTGVFAIGHDSAADTWTIRNGAAQSVEFVVRSEEGLMDLERHGFEAFAPRGNDVLLLRRDAGFAGQEQPEASSCHSVAAGDFDNDMDVDLFLVCSGPIRNLENRILVNDGRGRFRSVAAPGAAGDDLGRGDVVITADYDRDGFLDVFLTNGQSPSSPFVANGPHQLLRNRGNEHHWLEIDLIGTSSNVEAIGASVSIEAGGAVQYRAQDGGMHMYAQNHKRLHLGLGTHRRAERVVVRWPSGRVQTLHDVEADQLLTLREPRR